MNTLDRKGSKEQYSARDAALSTPLLSAHGANPEVVGRFAPSPSGRMHAGNVFSALCAWLIAKLQGGRIVLRIEDLDAQRSKQEHIDALMRDFETLGLTWDEGPFYQQVRHEAYVEAFEQLKSGGGVYPCFCTRADLHAASAPHASDKLVYPGTCRSLSERDRESLLAEKPAAYRLSVPDELCVIEDQFQGISTFNLANDCGDFVIRRFDGSFAYQLAVVVDDAAQGVNSVVRGVDLLDSSPQQRYLQKLLGFDEVAYAHVPLIVAPDGRRLAKRNQDAALDALLSRYKAPEAVLGHIAYLTGIIDAEEPVMPQDLLKALTLETLLGRLHGKTSIVFE